MGIIIEHLQVAVADCGPNDFDLGVGIFVQNVEYLWGSAESTDLLQGIFGFSSQKTIRVLNLLLKLFYHQI